MHFHLRQAVAIPFCYTMLGKVSYYNIIISCICNLFYDTKFKDKHWCLKLKLSIWMFTFANMILVLATSSGVVIPAARPPIKKADKVLEIWWMKSKCWNNNDGSKSFQTVKISTIYIIEQLLSCIMYRK